MKMKNRLFWFGANLAAYIFFLLAIIPFAIIQISKTTRILFITDGSERISFPWEWKWKEKK